MRTRWWAAIADIHPAWLSLLAFAAALVSLGDSGTPSLWKGGFFILVVIVQWSWIYGVYRIAVFSHGRQRWFARDWPFLLGLMMVCAHVVMTQQGPFDESSWLSAIGEAVEFAVVLLCLGTAINTASAISDACPRPRGILTERTGLALALFIAPVGAWLIQRRLKELRALTEVRAKLRDMA